MNRQYRINIPVILIASILWGAIITVSSGVWGHSDDWQGFEETVFHVVDAVVRNIVRGDVTRDEMTTLKNRVAALESLLVSYIQQKRCPSPEVCDEFKHIILTARNIVQLPPGGVFSAQEGEDIVFLREAAQSYLSSSPSAYKGAKTENQVTNQLHFSIAYVYRPKGKERFEPLPNGGIMHSGDLYKILFQPTQDCYVYIFQADASGKIYGIFPLEHFKGTQVNLLNPVQAEKIYFVPAQDKSFRLDEQTGSETIYFLAFQQPDRELEALYLEVINAQNADISSQIEETQRKFLSKLEAKGPAVVVSDSEKTERVSFKDDNEKLFSVLQRRLEGMCDGCVNTLTFTHQ
jgi:hypothetical protein